MPIINIKNHPIIINNKMSHTTSQQQDASSHSSQNRQQPFNHNDPTKIALNVSDSRNFIKEFLRNMEDGGYDFRYKNWDFEDDPPQHYTKLRHRSYLRHQCWRCVNNTNSTKQKEKAKRFTTSKGTAEIRFKLIKLDKFFQRYPSFHKKKQDEQKEKEKIKYPYVLMWDFYIYHMKCLKCISTIRYHDWEVKENPELVYAEPYIYQEILKEFLQKFYKHLVSLLNNQPLDKVKVPKKIKAKGMPRPHLIKHKGAYCQACAKGICNNYYADRGQTDQASGSTSNRSNPPSFGPGRNQNESSHSRRRNRRRRNRSPSSSSNSSNQGSRPDDKHPPPGDRKSSSSNLNVSSSSGPSYPTLKKSRHSRQKSQPIHPNSNFKQKSEDHSDYYDRQEQCYSQPQRTLKYVEKISIKIKGKQLKLERIENFGNKTDKKNSNNGNINGKSISNSDSNSNSKKGQFNKNNKKAQSSQNQKKVQEKSEKSFKSDKKYVEKKTVQNKLQVNISKESRQK